MATARGSRILCAGLTVAGLLVAAPSASAVTDATAILNLNVQRTANQIPAGILIDPSFSSGCAAHDNYMHLNNGLEHTEDPSKPGYTAAGDDAGRHSVLSLGSPPWTTAADNPWETAPIHLAQILDPSLLVTGYSESFGYACLQTLQSPRRTPPPTTTIYTYPGPGGTIYSSLRAAELPVTPGQLAGVPQNAVTGPYIYVLLDGPDRAAIDTAHIVKATLRRTKGRKKRKVRLAVVDGTTPVGLSGINLLGDLIPPGGMLIPRKGLKPGKYKGSVTVVAAGQALTKALRFRAD